MTLIYRFGYTLFRGIGEIFFGHKVVHKNRLIEDGPALIVCNHESFLDPPFVGVSFDKEIYYLARKTLMKGKFLEWIYKSWNSVPVDQERPDMTSLKTIIRLLKEGNRVLIFPEGERTRTGELGPAQPGVGLIIAKSKVPVIPMRIFGAREALPRGKTLPQASEITMVVGEPIHFSDEEFKAMKGKEAYQKVAEDVMAAIGKIELER